MALLASLSYALGLHAEMKTLTVAQIVLRAVVVFSAALIMARLADKRVFSKKTPFDIILALILASMLSRAINGSAALVGSLVAGFVMVLLHRLLGWMACHWDLIGAAIKGRGDTLIEEGCVIERNMRRNHFSHEDLREDLRLRAATDDVSQVKSARMERNGEVSVVLRTKDGGD